MSYFSYQGNNYWLEHSEAESLYDYLSENVDLLGGSQLFDDLIAVYEELNTNINDLKEDIKSKEESIDSLESHIQDLEEQLS